MSILVALMNIIRMKIAILTKTMMTKNLMVVTVVSRLEAVRGRWDG